jgi:hypothetical protein
MSNPITVLPASNSVCISDPTGLAVLGQSAFGVYGIQPWMSAISYQSKYTFDDTLNITAHIQGNIPLSQASSANLYLCDYYEPNTGKYRVYGSSIYNTTSGSSVDLNIAPYLKGYQQLTGNSYINPLSNDSGTPLLTYMWSFSFSDLEINQSGTYYLLLINACESLQTFPHPVVITPLFSEPILMQATHPNTLLFQSRFNTNKSDNWNVVITGWWNDFPINSIPFNPTFTQRVEGYVIDFDLKAVQVGYLQQSWQQLQTFAKWVRMKTLKIGEISVGVPPHIIEAVTAQILADTYWINGYSYINFNNSNSSQLGDLWKTRRPDDAYPLLFASTAIMERYQSQGSIVTPPPPLPDNYFAPDYFSGGFA